MSERSLKAEPGAVIRLIRDFYTRGGVTFRAGLVMRIDYADRGWHCSVKVRGRRRRICVQKNHARFYFEVIEPARKRKEDE